MRIIAGEFRGRKLLPPATDATRPITDRVKQSLFDILTPRMPDAVVYDCFAGTGSMGLESLSRGATQATFFEADRSAIERLQQNIDTLGVEARSTVISGDIFGWFADPKKTGKATIAFLDPPFRFSVERAEDLRRMMGHLLARHLAADGIVVFRHAADASLDLPGLSNFDQRTYGGMAIQFLRTASPS